MSSGPVSVFVSVTHGPAKDCRRANAKLKETLENYSFAAFVMEKACHVCSNDDCNTSFLLILRSHEFHRLKNQVAFDVRPNFLVHKSFREIIESDRKIRLALLGENSVGVQVGPEMVAKIVDACPPSSNTFCQTDFKTWTKDTAGQTDVVEIRNSEAQCESSKTTLSFTTVQSSDFEPRVQNISVETAQSVSPMRSAEVQKDESDDEIIFIQSVPRTIVPNQPKEVKQEEQENTPVAPVQRVVEPVVVPIAEPPPPPAAVKQEPAEQVMTPRAAFAPPPLARGFTTPGSVKRVFNNSFMATPLSSRSNSTSFYSASITSHSGSESSPSNSKRQKLSEVDMCQMCLEVSYFTPLEEYCQHVLEMHSSISRFKCNVCQHKFPGSIAANYHARVHMSEGDLRLSPSEPLVSMEISEEHLHRFIKTAHQCYPDKFRNVSIHEIAEIVKKLP